MHGFLHESSLFIVGAVKFAAEQMHAVTRKYGLNLNKDPGKTEAILALRGSDARRSNPSILEQKGLAIGEVILRTVPAYKHLGTLVTYTATPTRDAAL